MGAADSKNEFREKVDRFVNGSVSTDDDEVSLMIYNIISASSFYQYWNSLLHVPLSFAEVQDALSSDDIRKLRKQQSSNLEHFFRRVGIVSIV